MSSFGTKIVSPTIVLKKVLLPAATYPITHTRSPFLISTSTLLSYTDF